MFKKSAFLLISFVTFNVFANDDLPIQSGNTGGAITLSMKVPSLCNIKNNNSNFADFNFGEYIGNNISYSASFLIDCKSTTSFSFAIDLGSNPKSTPSLRRMPKDGEVGDVKYFVNYRFTVSSSINSTVIGDKNSPYKVNNSSATTYLTFYAHLLAIKDQQGIVLGDYHDTLDAYFDYY